MIQNKHIVYFFILNFVTVFKTKILVVLQSAQKKLTMVIHRPRILLEKGTVKTV